MKDSEEIRREKIFARMRSICRVIRTCFFIAMVIAATSWFFLLISAAAERQALGEMLPNVVVYISAYGILVVLVLWNLTLIFQEVVKGRPPFSEIQADRLRAIAIVSIAYVVLELLISFGCAFEPDPALGFGVAVNNGVDVPTLNLNIGMLVFSAIMYSLSAIFRYAALLQQLSDETV